jgi:hypothetical protein
VQRVIRGRTGHQLLIAESANAANEIRLETGDKKYKLVLDKKNTEILIDSDGKVTIKSKKGVAIDAGSGALELKGKSVEITGDSVKMASKKGASVEVAQAGTTLTGKPIKLN